MLTLKLQIIVAITIISALCIIINMIRRKSLELRYALSWLTAGIGILILDLFPDLIKTIADIMGIDTPANMLFFLGFCFSLGLTFVLTIAISRMSVRMKKIAQELALYQKELETLKSENAQRGRSRIPFYYVPFFTSFTQDMVNSHSILFVYFVKLYVFICRRL